MSAMMPSSPIGLPSTLDYKLPPSLSEDSKSYYVNIAPDGLQAVSGGINIGTGAGTLPIAAAGGLSVLSNFNSQTLTFTIPSGTSRDTYLDPRETTLSFRMTLVVTTAPTVGTSVVQCLISSAQSFIENLQLFSNNVPLESISAYGLLANQLLMSTVNLAQRQAGVAICMGCDSDSQSGIDLPTAVGTYYYNFSIPLISMIGLNAGDRFLPIGSISNLQLAITTSPLLPIASYTVGAVTVAGAQGVTLDQFSLNMKYISIGGMSQALLSQTLADGKYFLKAKTWTTANVNIPANSGGQINQLLQIRNSSLKSIICQNSQQMNAVTPNGLYDAVNLGVSMLNVSVNGWATPQAPLNPSQRPGQCFQSYLAALGYAGDMRLYGGCIARNNYGRTVVTVGPGNSVINPDNMLVVPATGQCAQENGSTGGLVTCIKNPSMHFYGFDFEKSSGLLFNGVNSRASPPILNQFIIATTPSANATTTVAFGLVDCVLVIDSISQTIQAFV